MRRLVLLLVLLFLASFETLAQGVRCESLSGEYRECYVASSGKIILSYELSELACVQGVTWGTASEGRVWVQRGCRAIFVAGVEVPPSVPADRVVCESGRGGRSFCSTRKFASVTLARQLSNTPCEEGGTWGYDPERGEIWVYGGCRGEFLVGAVPDEEKKPEPLDAIVVCKSEGGKKKVKCEADTSGGVQLFRPLLETQCRFEEDWGYDRKGIWVRNGCQAEFAVKGRPRPTIQSLTCESPDGSPAKCEADTTYGVAIVRELGEDRCVAGETWGFDDGGVWVAKKCVAQFALGGYRLPPDAVPATAARVTCESKPGGENRCSTETARGVGLIRDLGASVCVLNRNWGYDASGIWVRDGCSAEFAVAR